LIPQIKKQPKGSRLFVLQSFRFHSVDQQIINLPIILSERSCLVESLTG
jgi:hypothetical protein